MNLKKLMEFEFLNKLEKKSDFIYDKIGYSADIKQNIRRVFWLYFVLFAVLVIHIFKFIAIDSKEVISSPYNPRVKLFDGEIKRGNILDSKGNILAQSFLDTSGYFRDYPYGRIFSHLIGYSINGKSGIEAAYNFQLESLDWEVWQRLNNIITGSPMVGNSITLTIDAGLQEKCYNLLAKQKGAIVVMEPSTGKILSMVSYPNYNPNEVGQKWTDLSNDTENSPFLNRATQGLYPPGSTFKIITAASAFEFMPNYEEFTYNCEGEVQYTENKIRCFNLAAHGVETIRQAFPVSCNTLFSYISKEIGGDNMKNLAERLYFNKNYPFPLQHSKSSFVLNGWSSENEMTQTAIGQGKTLVTPLHMAMITSAVANGGIMMEPYVVDYSTTKWGTTKNKHIPKSIGQVFTFEESEFIKDMMVQTITYGSGVPAAVSGIEVAGKTGTAENSSGADHGWFVAFAPADEPKVVVSILLENSDGPRNALKISKEIMKYYF